MVPPGEADFLLVLNPDQIEPNRASLRPGGILIEPAMIPPGELRNQRSLNVALLGVLSRHLEIPESAWQDAIRANLPPKLHEVNMEAFQKGRTL
jgi:indolepyruvate ferredoxin oxidoreductase beta subunit